MAKKYRVPLQGKMGFVQVEDGATAGAILGTDLVDASGNVVPASDVLNSELQPQLDTLAASLAGKQPALSTTATSASAGAAAALPATPEGYVQITVGGQPMMIPYFLP